MIDALGFVLVEETLRRLRSEFSDTDTTRRRRPRRRRRQRSQAAPPRGAGLPGG
jgi:hypothetical protein